MTKRTTAFLVLLGVPALLLALDWALALDPERRNYEVFYEMVNAVSAESYSPNDAFADGSAQQSPPEGTIARGALPDDPAVPASSPFAADDRAALARGESVFQNHCAVCHGLQGAGDGPVVRRGVPAPPAFSAERLGKLTDAQLEKLIADGGKAPLDEAGASAGLAVATGAGNMPAYGAQVPRADRWRVVLFVRKLAGGGK